MWLQYKLFCVVTTQAFCVVTTQTLCVATTQTFCGVTTQTFYVLTTQTVYVVTTTQTFCEETTKTFCALREFGEARENTRLDHGAEAEGQRLSPGVWWGGERQYSTSGPPTAIYCM